MAGELGTDLVNGLMNPPPDPNDPRYQAWLKAQQGTMPQLSDTGAVASPIAPTPPPAPASPPADTGSQLATATAPPTLNLNHPTYGLSLSDYYKWQKTARAGGTPDREGPIRPLPTPQELAQGTEPARAPPGDTRPSLSASPRSPSEVSRDAQVTALRQGGMAQDKAEEAAGVSSLATEIAPVSGTALAGADTAYHFGRKEFAPAALAALGVIPGVGKVVQKGIKAAGKGVNKTIAKAVGEVADDPAAVDAARKRVSPPPSSAPTEPAAELVPPKTTGEVAASAAEPPPGKGVGFWAHPEGQEGVAPLPLQDVKQDAGKTGRRAAITATNFRDMPLEEANKAAAGMRHIIAKPDGTIVGAPTHVRTAADIDNMRTQFDRTLRVGESADYNWYQDMRDMISEGTRGMGPPTPRNQPPRIGHNQGPPLDDVPAPKQQGTGDLLASELAHTSPQRQPDPNLGAAIRMHNAYELGKPLERFPTGRAARAYIAARDADTPVREILGKKTGVYQKGLSPDAPWGTTGTNDIWHARAFDYKSPTGRPWEAALTPQQHSFMDGETILATQRANAAKLGGRDDWKPLEVQAMAWVGKRAESYMADGIPREEAMQLAKRSYREAQDKYTAGVVSETTPGLKTRHRTDVSEGSEEARQEYFDKTRWAEPGGADPLYAGAGIYQRPTQDATGVYQMPGGPLERNPAERFSPYVGRTGKTGQREMDPESASVMKQVEQLRATLGVQNAAAFFMETPTNAVKRLTSMGFNPGGQLTIEQVQRLQEVGKKYGVGDVMHAGPGRAYMTDFSGEKRPGFTKQKAQSLGDELASEIPGAGGERTDITTHYEPLHKQWQQKGPDPGGEGSGAVTRKLFRIFKSDKLMDNLAGEGGAGVRAHVEKLIQDNMQAQAKGAPVRQDVMNLYKTLISSKVPGIDMRALQTALKAGAVSLPAVGLIVGGLPDVEGLQGGGDRERL